MKKLLCILLSIVMVFCLTCCNNDTNDETIVSGEGNLSTELSPETEKASLSSFKTLTLDGEEVDQSIFKGKITMVNIWATFCSPCINEMPDLQKLAEDYADKNFQIVGIVCDVYQTSTGYEPSLLKAAEHIVEQTGVKYVNLLPSDSLKEAKLNSVTSVPETFFLNEKGEVIGSSFIGSRSYENWAKIIDDILA